MMKNITDGWRPATRLRPPAASRKGGGILRWSTLLTVVWLALCWGAGLAGADPGEAQRLLAKYPTIKDQLEKNQFGAPIYLDSTETDHSVAVDMYGVFPHPFAVIKEALRSPPNWCDITSLHINVKACTTTKSGDQWYVTLYNGRKYYQPPSDAYPLKLKFNLLADTADYLNITMSANQGPLHTKDHRIRLEAAPLGSDKTFVHFSYTYAYGAMAKMAIRSYFATIGRDKVGFSVLPGKGGRYYYVDGVRGSVERNTVRYYLAVDSYVDTLEYPAGQRLEKRLNRWYDLTAKYPRQLKEMDKAEYLATKRRERVNMITLQKGTVSSQQDPAETAAWKKRTSPAGGEVTAQAKAGVDPATTLPVHAVPDGFPDRPALALRQGYSGG